LIRNYTPCFSRETGALPLDLDLKAAGWSLVTAQGTRQRGWLGTAAVDASTLERWVASATAEERATYVSDLVQRVQQQHGEVPQQTLLEAVQHVVHAGRAMTYSGQPDQSNRPTQVERGHLAGEALRRCLPILRSLLERVCDDTGVPAGLERYLTQEGLRLRLSLPMDEEAGAKLALSFRLQERVPDLDRVELIARRVLRFTSEEAAYWLSRTTSFGADANRWAPVGAAGDAGQPGQGPSGAAHAGAPAACGVSAHSCALGERCSRDEDQYR
jgi:hypothetical protein